MEVSDDGRAARTVLATMAKPGISSPGSPAIPPGGIRMPPSTSPSIAGCTLVVLASDNVYLYETTDKHVPVVRMLDPNANLRAQDRMRTIVLRPDLIMPGLDLEVSTHFPKVASNGVRIQSEVGSIKDDGGALAAAFTESTTLGSVTPEPEVRSADSRQRTSPDRSCLTAYTNQGKLLHGPSIRTSYSCRIRGAVTT
jgi:hypothetical protein